MTKHSNIPIKTKRLLNGEEYEPEYYEPSNIKSWELWASAVCIVILTVIMIVMLLGCAQAYTVEQYANAIYKAENSPKHPYGILAKYQHTTPRQACINTIKHRLSIYRRLKPTEPFTAFLGASYCPIGSDTDNGTCQYWVKNVNYWLKKG